MLATQFPMADRIKARSIPVTESGCWLWTGTDNGKGYGKIWTGNRLEYAHRASYEAFVGKIPMGLYIDHLCRVRCCVNPNHLEAVTNKENILRGEGSSAKRARATQCPHGHSYDEMNTYINKYGYRSCRICRDNRNKSRYK